MFPVAFLRQQDRNDFRQLTTLLVEVIKNTMSEVADSIRRGLEEAVVYVEGRADENAYRVHVPEEIDVRAIHTRLDMTQEGFAGPFGFSVNTLRHWEQGSRQSEGPTRAYLLVIEHAPKAVQEALRAVDACRVFLDWLRQNRRSQAFFRRRTTKRFSDFSSSTFRCFRWC